VAADIAELLDNKIYGSRIAKKAGPPHRSGAWPVRWKGAAIGLHNAK
jgi:hypothetical protein